MRTEDGDLIRKCLNGDSSAFGFLVDKYKECVYASAYAKLRNFQDAEDLTQEVFLKGHQNLRTLRQYDRFLSWLYAITSNLCKNFLRSKGNCPDREFVEDIEQELLDAPSMEAYREGRKHESLYEALEALPEMYRQVLTLRYLGGMKSREIAQFLGTSKNTIDQRLFRAKSQLKEEMLIMMTTTFDEMKLQPGFTFRIVELIKGAKIQPIPRSTGIPLGLSITAGLLALLLSLTIPLSPLYPIGELIGSALPSKTQVAEGGVIPMDTIEVTEITILSSEHGEGDFGQKPKPEPIQAFSGGGKWTERENMPTARWGVGTSVVDGKIYAIGGRGEGKDLSTVEVYDPATDTWSKKADMPNPRVGVAIAVVNGRIYTIGGSQDLGKVNFSTVEAYDPATDTWSKKADMPTPKCCMVAAVVNGKIYLIGGWSEVEGRVLSTVDVYNPAKDAWSNKADMPTPRADLALAVVNGKIYAIGGAEGGLGNWRTLSTVEVYDPATDTWDKKADMPTHRAIFGHSIVNGKIYVIGGLSIPGPLRAIVEAYDPVTDTWTRETDMPTARRNLSTSAVNGKIYAIGGAVQGNRTLSIVEEFDPEGVPENLPQSVNPAGKLTAVWGRLKATR